MTSLSDLRNVLDDLESRANESGAAEKRLKLFEGLLSEIGAALADLLENLGKPKAESEHKPVDFDPIVKAIKALKLSAPAFNPTINVPAQPAPSVIVNPTIQAESWRTLEIKLNKGQYGTSPLESLTITKIK